MAATTSHSTARRSLILFGPLDLLFDATTFDLLKEIVHGAKGRHQWVVDTIAELPQCYRALEKAGSHLFTEARLALLQDLANWIKDDGRPVKVPETLPNTILSPLVVLTQLLQYHSYLDLVCPPNVENRHLHAATQNLTETLGFCTGLLSAFAISTSTSDEQLRTYGATAIRLAMLVGAAVDSQEEPSQSGPSQVFSVSWHSEQQKSDLDKTLEQFASDAYISVAYDENRATLTSANSVAASLQAQLRTQGLTTTSIGLQGRFHWAGNQHSFESLDRLCASDTRFQFPEASHLFIQTRSNLTGHPISEGSLTQEALRAILITQAQWHQAFSQVKRDVLSQPGSVVISCGKACIPPSMLRTQDIQVIQISDITPVPGGIASQQPRSKNGYLDSDIAVVGMACKAPGANNLEEFWDLLCKGQSQHKEVPSERFGFETGHRPVDPNRKWYGNFIDDYDTFDHKFFKKSPRESASQDPQQRQLLQVAYQAVEQSGYFHSRKMQTDPNIGCYVGVCAVDYESNVACHAPSAFTATGNLRGFIAGKISHYFGWKGPGLTLDSACSSSTVAVHQACQSILSGECNAALAAGTHVMTNPLWYQNLAGASFLSTTGACKPFDAKADGYCRGEAVAAVFLKRMSQAVADGDTILGTIAASAVKQNDNSTPIFVPNSNSLAELFDTVTRRAAIDPHHIGVVEAHGTGTPVGDPAEYSSVRRVLGGTTRSSKLFLSSVKGLIGHSECTSGLMSLIKTLLIIMKGAVPPQASFDTLSPGLRASSQDQIIVPTSFTPWTPSYRAALINNYGASGSNASLVVAQPPSYNLFAQSTEITETKTTRVPFRFSAYDDNSLRKYATSLVQYLRSAAAKDVSLEDLAFANSRQSNGSLDRSLFLSAASKSELQDRLLAFASGNHTDASVPRSASRPVILCFGGQVSSFVGLERQVYDSFGILRKHLGACNAVCISQGLPSISPGIFEREPISDPVRLQTMLFALQYSCAKSWIESGVEPVALVGHSFGELTALAVANVLSLDDAIRLVADRANVIKESWGLDKGGMVAVEGQLDLVRTLLEEVNGETGGESPAIIACFNGPTTFTISGSTKAVDVVCDALSNRSAYSRIKYKRLNVTHAFHSTLVDPLKPLLEINAASLKFKEPSIHLERSTARRFTGAYTAQYVAEHMREPVFFRDSTSRLHDLYPSSIWLEAGSASTVTKMVSRSLGAPAESVFQGLNITGEDGLTNLSEATTNLWKAGVDVTFWSHHASQVHFYKPVLLPPYQFEKARHWLELKAPVVAKLDAKESGPEDSNEPPDTLLTLLSHQKGKKQAQFRINTSIAQYEALVEGHVIVHTAPICPATVQLDLVIEALRSIEPELVVGGYDPQICNVANQAPLCRDDSRIALLDLSESKTQKDSWKFEISSRSKQGTNVSRTTHTSGEITLKHFNDQQIKAEFAQYERLSSHRRCVELLESTDAEDAIHGRNIYRAFSPVVDYGPNYRGLKKLVGGHLASAGRVVKKYNSATWFDAHLADCFAQVGGIWVNCMTNHDPSDIYIANGIERWMRSPAFRSGALPETWDVAAYHHGPVGKSYTTDVFAYDPTTGALLDVILGINYVRVPKTYMSKVLTSLTKPGSETSTKVDQHKTKSSGNAAPSGIQAIAESPSSAPKIPIPPRQKLPSPKIPDYVDKVRSILADIAGLELAEIKLDSQLANLGIDSLVGMEMAKDIETKLQCSLPNDDLVQVTDVSGLMKCVATALGEAVGDTLDEGYQTQTPALSTPSEKSLEESPLQSGPDLKSFLANFFGIEASDIKSGTALRDIGLDSLLSMELRADLASTYDISIDEHVTIEDLDIDAFELLCGGGSRLQFDPVKDSPSSAVKAPAASPDLVQPKPCVEDNLLLPGALVVEAFQETKALTDNLIVLHQLDVYAGHTGPDQTQLCVLLTIEALEELGCPLRHAKAGDVVQKVSAGSEHTQFVHYLYKMVAENSGLIKEEGGCFLRTDIPVPTIKSAELFEEINRKWPAEKSCNDLTYYAGTHLAQVFRGETDGIKLIFGSPKGRDLVSKVYGDWPMNKMYYQQMQNFLSRLVSKLPKNGAPLKILEMGAGTGGTTKHLIPLIASLGYPIEYTFTDLGPSFVAAARKQFKEYKFMKFGVHDIEKEPAEDLIGTQHIVIASNAVHATHNLATSTGNIRKMLRPDGLLMMLEMTGTMYWCDIVFGLFEGWWLFSDGRSHAVTSETQWKTVLQSVRYGHVDWTDGARPENKLERLIIAMASESRYDANPSPKVSISESEDADIRLRKAAIDEYVNQKTRHFHAPIQSMGRPRSTEKCVLLTGATGSLGSHLVASLAEDPSFSKIICLNRRNRSSAPRARQEKAMEDKGLIIPAWALEKVQVIETVASKPDAGLSSDTYAYLVDNITHIVHNAWLMNAKLPLNCFESQFDILRNLIDLARDISSARGPGFKLTFQFISSIAVVGHYPIWKNTPIVPEEKMQVQAVLNNGYGDAKYICELMLEQTLQKYPDSFKTMSVRIGQIAGSKKSGYWNPMEHLSFLWKSSQAIGALPDFDGPLSWTSVDDVAGTLRDFLLVDQPYQVYHIDNPVRQPWKEMIPVLADALDIPRSNMIPFDTWVAKVREGTNLLSERENPAIKLIDFLDGNFLRMSCGGLLLSTTKSTEHSATLRSVGPVSKETVLLFVKSWKKMKFLS